MHAPFEMTEGQRTLAAISETLPPDRPHWNEARNRYQFVDRLLGVISDVVLGAQGKSKNRKSKEARREQEESGEENSGFTTYFLRLKRRKYNQFAVGHK